MVSREKSTGVWETRPMNIANNNHWTKKIDGDKENTTRMTFNSGVKIPGTLSCIK